MQITPVILSGGAGSRLWPLSRAAYPKQLLALAGAKTMLQATLDRAGALPGAQAPLVVCNQEHRFLVREQCIASGHNPGKIDLHLIEVQSGAYLGEDDIVRFEDTYGRAATA